MEEKQSKISKEVEKSKSGVKKEKKEKVVKKTVKVDVKTNVDNNKKLNIIDMKEIDKINDKKEIIDVHGYFVEVHKVFRPSLIRKAIGEILEKLNFLKEKDVDLESFDFSSYILFILIKHFSDLECPETLEEQIEMINIMVDNDFLIPIIASFPEEEVKKFNEKILEMTENINLYAEDLASANIEKIRSEIRKQLSEEESKDIEYIDVNIDNVNEVN